ncbi:MAG: sigma-70 region 4 domain-containing protein [Bacteroidetes bacterium]|nr:sigma-70 region 4 domain-containing protein [Bacteroidota bacterium]MCL6102404.1 sigma-70 region 4 domain-containing protein [Bacteroidota bacterium]
MKSRQESKSSKEIAVELGLSSGTVDNWHLKVYAIGIYFVGVQLKMC